MKQILLPLILLLTVVFSEAQNCPQGSCSISVNVIQDSCPSSPQTFSLHMVNHWQVCATDVPSSLIPNQTSANYCTTSDPSNAVNCPASQYRTAHVSASACVQNPMTASTIQSVYFNLLDSTLANGSAVGTDPKVWLKSPAGTYLLLNSPRPFNSNDQMNTCYCPTYTPSGTDGVLPNWDGPFSACNYTPEGGALGAAFTSQSPNGVWTLYVNDNVDLGGLSFGTLKIGAFCMTFDAAVSSNAVYTWSSDSANCLAYLSSLTVANPVFTPPAGYYDCTYYVTVYDSTCGCSGSDTVHVTCASTISVESLNNAAADFHVAVHNSEITFSYPSSTQQREIIVNDITGKEVMRYRLPKQSSVYTAQLPAIARGIYVARLAGSTVSANVKFVIGN